MNQNIHFRIENEIAILTFDKVDSSANIFDRSTFDELQSHLDTIEKSSVRGMVITSAKPSIFIAGADISEFSNLKDEEAIRSIVRRGQNLFNRISDLKIPTVAAIHGVALGGGCEIALACDYRIVSPDKKSKLGLPEIQLGILPAWGGCYRLPKLIGLVAALDKILAGKNIAPIPAKKLGLVDLIGPQEHFLTMATSLIESGKPSDRRAGSWMSQNWLSRKVVYSKAKSMTTKATKGHYPAPLRALDVINSGFGQERSTAMKLEEDALVDLIQTDQCQNLVKVFFLQERAKKLAPVKYKSTSPISKIAVIGAGTMGAGIAQWSSARGQQVILKDVEPERLRAGMETIASLYKKATARHIFTKTEARIGIDRIYTTHFDVPMQSVELIIEAATENLHLKKKIFKDLEALSGKNTIFATNTSALSIDEIGSELNDPSRLIGIHYFNPVSKMQLVEVIAGSHTSPAVIAKTIRFVQASGKLPVLVKDRPGFVVNRVLMPYLIEAVHLFENGLSAEKIDQAMVQFGMPMGPLRLADEVGLDVCNHVAKFFKETFPNQFPPSNILDQMLESEMLGKKNGFGFYNYKNKKTTPNSGLRSLRNSETFRGLSSTEIQNRLVGLIVNESAKVLEEGVVGSPEDVDFAMIFGTGFAPFRGGPLRFADQFGIEKMVEQLDHFAKENERYLPSDSMRLMAASSTNFYKDSVGAPHVKPSPSIGPTFDNFSSSSNPNSIH